MDLMKFVNSNLARSGSPQGFNHSLRSWSIAEWHMATSGELGEFANIAKKLIRIRDGIPGNEVGDTEESLKRRAGLELADTLTYLTLLAESLGIDLGEAVVEKFNMKSSEIGYPYTMLEDGSLIPNEKPRDNGNEEEV